MLGRFASLIHLALAACALGGFERDARADEAPPASADPPLEVHVTYDVTYESCPSEGAFVDAVHARTRNVHLDSHAAAATSSLDVRVAPVGTGASGWRGELSMREADQTTEQRSIEGASCKEVVTGLALIASLLLQDEAARAKRTPPVAPLATQPSAPASPPPALPSPAAPPPSRATVIAPPPPKTKVATGLGLGAMSAMGPGLAPALTIFGEVSHAFEPEARPWLRPSLRLLLESATTSRGVESGTHDYRLLDVTTRGCPVRLPLGDRLAFAPCFGFVAGSHRARATGVTNATSRSDLWLAPAASAALTLTFGRDLFLELEAGAHVPLRRTRFILAPARTLYETPEIGGFARLTFGIARFL